MDKIPPDASKPTGEEPNKKPIVSKAPPPISPVGNSSVRRPELFRAVTIAYDYAHEYPEAWRARIKLAEIEAVGVMEATAGIIHCVRVFVMGAGELGRQGKWSTDQIAAEIDKNARWRGIEQGIRDSHLRTLLAVIRSMPEYKQAIQDVAEAQIARASGQAVAEVQPPTMQSAHKGQNLQGRPKVKRGPLGDDQLTRKIVVVVQRCGGADWQTNWKANLPAICKELDAKNIPRPSDWELVSWFKQLTSNRALVRKAIYYRITKFLDQRGRE